MAGTSDVLEIPLDDEADFLDIDVDQVGGLDTDLTGGEAGQVKMLGPAGRVTYANPDEVEGYQGLGYVVEGIGDTISRASAEGLQEGYGGVGGQIEAGGQAVLRGASFGASDQFLDSETAAALKQANPYTAIGGELLGAVAPSLLSGAPGVVGAAFRLTPQGALAAATANYVSRGATTAARVGRGIGAGLVEAEIETAGNYLSQLALDEDAEFSGAELGRRVAVNGLIGAAAGGLGGAVTPIADDVALTNLRRALPDEDAAKVRELLGDSGKLSVQTRRIAGADARRFKKADDLIDLEEIASPGMVTRSRQSYGKLQERIADASRRSASDEVEDVIGSPVLRAALGDDEYAAVTSRLRTLAKEHDEATSASRKWGDAHAASIGAPKNAKEFTAAMRRVAPELDAAAGPTLARLDDATVAFDDEIAKVRAALGVVENLPPQVRSAALLSPEVTNQVRSFLGNAAAAVKSNPLVAKTLEVGEKAAAAAELAQMAGVDVPSVSSILGRDNVIGKAVGAFIAARAGARAFRGLGDEAEKLGLKSTTLTRAAKTVNDGKVRLLRTLDSAVATATRKLRGRAVPLMSTGAVKAFSSMDPAMLRAQAAAETSELPNAVASAALAQVDRVAGYLDKNRPRNPNEGTPWAKDWSAGPVAEAEYARRARAALDPDWALMQVFSKPGNSLEVEALKTCHPDLWSRAQARLMELSDAERDAMSEAMRQSLGRAFNVPLSITQLPGYGATRPLTAPMQPAAQFGSPSAAMTSPFVSGEQVEGPRGRRG